VEAEGFDVGEGGSLGTDFFGECGEGGVEGGFVEVVQWADFVGHFLSRVNQET